MKSKNCLHSPIVISIGFTCWDMRELRVGSSPLSTTLARKRNTPQTSWMIFSCLVEGWQVIVLLCILLFHTIIWFDMVVGLILLLCRGGGVGIG